MPMRARNFGRLVRASPTETVSTVILPSSKGSSPLTHLIKVLLPEPEGPDDDDLAPGDRSRAIGEDAEIAVPFAEMLDLDHIA